MESEREKIRRYFHAVREATGWSWNAWAERAGTSASNVSRFARDPAAASIPQWDTLAKLCAVVPPALGIAPPRLPGAGDAAASPSPSPVPFDPTSARADVAGETFVFVGGFDDAVSAGPGALINARPEPSYRMAFRLEWLRQRTAASVADLAVLRISGDSMWETLHDGDHVLVDRSVGNYSRDGLYVIRYAGMDEVMVKRLIYNPRTRTFTVKSDNPAYDPQPDVTPEDLNIEGRVIWLGRNLG